MWATGACSSCHWSGERCVHCKDTEGAEDNGAISAPPATLLAVETSFVDVLEDLDKLEGMVRCVFEETRSTLPQVFLTCGRVATDFSQTQLILISILPSQV